MPISSNDPTAIIQLKAKRDALTTERDTYKKINAQIKLGKKHEEIPELTESYRESLLRYARFSYHKITDKLGAERSIFPPFLGTNLGAEIRRCTQRIEELEAEATRAPAEAITREDCTVEEHPEEDRMWISFRARTSREEHAVLKRNGFKYSPTRNAYVRQLTANARASVEYVLNELRPKATDEVKATEVKAVVSST